MTEGKEGRKAGGFEGMPIRDDKKSESGRDQPKEAGMMKQKNLPAKESGRHIVRDQFCDWLAGEMKPPAEERFLGHIGCCTFCAQQFAEWMEEGIPLQESNDLLSEPPGYLKEEILRRTQQMDVQAAVCFKETSRRVQLLMYSLKVGMAVVASIFLLMVTANIQDMNIQSVRTQQQEQAQEARKEREDREKEISITDTLKLKSREVSSFLNELSNGLFRIEKESDLNQEVTR